MDLALWLHQHGLSAPSAALWATLGVCAALVLAGVACVAYIEGLELRSQRTARGATRINRREVGQRRRP